MLGGSQRCLDERYPAGQSLAGVLVWVDPRLTPAPAGRWHWEVLVPEEGLEPTRGSPPSGF